MIQEMKNQIYSPFLTLVNWVYFSFHHGIDRMHQSYRELTLFPEKSCRCFLNFTFSQETGKSFSPNWKMLHSGYHVELKLTTEQFIVAKTAFCPKVSFIDFPSFPIFMKSYLIPPPPELFWLFLFRYLLGPKAVTFTILRHPIQVFESLYAYADFNAILKLDIHEYIKLWVQLSKWITN